MSNIMRGCSNHQNKNKKGPINMGPETYFQRNVHLSILLVADLQIWLKKLKKAIVAIKLDVEKRVRYKGNSN